MTDVDAIRFMASEHDLEFVDLTTYGVDRAAGEILPSDLARRHHMVAIKRKFGTPVIATSDPDDLYAQDSVRASLGRDFISVVASREQIADYLDQLFGSEIDDVQSGELGRPTWEEPEDRTLLDGDGGLESTAAATELELISSIEMGPDTADNAEIVDFADRTEVIEDVESTDASESNAEQLPDLRLADAAGVENEPAQESPRSNSPGSSGRRGKKGERKGKAAAPAEDKTPDAEFEAAISWEGAAAGDESGVPEPADSGGYVGESDGAGSGEDVTQPQGPQVLEYEAAEQDLAAEHLSWSDDGSSLEPSTALLPEFGAEDFDELARSLQDTEFADADLTTDAADLVSEAVATFQEQQGEGWYVEADGVDGSGLAGFPPLAKVLVDGGRVSLEAMEEVLEEHERTGQSFARILTDKKLVTEADLMWGMAEEMGLEFVDLDTASVDLAEAGTIPEATARHHNVVVIANDNGTPVVAASNPTDVFAMDDLRTIIGRNFIVVVATRSQISSYISRVFNSGGDAADMAMEASRGFDGSERDSGVDDIQAITEEAPIVRYVNLLILQALNERASDIHVEPTGSELRIRYRIDGVLHDVSTAPRTIASAVTTRLKVMADMNVAEHRVPQDGRISLNVGAKGIDLRMATLPTIHGEKVVMRVLDKSSVVLGFGDLGFDGDLLHTYESIYTKPYGTILVTGPTGSGKSTTLYTTLTALNSSEKNIITVEDPVELQLKGVNQVQLNVKAGLTFASALKSILRSDPDIVLIGEIRDKETAVIAVEAALTGHMVLATLHTNSAASTPMRLIEMGLEPFLVTSALSGVLAQRLARRLCVNCKEAYEPTDADITSAGWTPEEVELAGGMPKVYRAVGCSACSNTGYRGRKALAELMPMTEEIERMIIEGGSVEEIHKVALSQGMMTLRQSGLRKAIEGETTLEEVLRVVA